MKYILGKIVTALVTMFLVSVFCFFAFGVIRGDPANFLAGINATPEYLENLRREIGLDRNIVIRYIDWLVNFLSGNPGDSIRFRGENISSMINERLPVSFTLALTSLLLILIISLPVSLLTVKREGSLPDRITNFLTAGAISAPGFFIGLLFIWIFGLVFHLFTPGLFIDYKENLFEFLKCLFFPALAIAVPNSAILIKFLRGSIFQELKKDYVRTAKSKGAGRLYILRRHVLKNSLIPAVTIFGMIIAEIFSGSIIIEQVFTIPGIGRLLVAAVSSRDYPLIQTLMVYIAFIVVLANTLADIAIMLLDPRIRTFKEVK